jgi:hypothetical protein
MQGQTFGGITFNVGNRYQINKLIGSGAYGHVTVGYDSTKKGLKVLQINLKLL